MHDVGKGAAGLPRALIGVQDHVAVFVSPLDWEARIGGEKLEVSDVEHAIGGQRELGSETEA